jgi:formiminoglutamase
MNNHLSKVNGIQIAEVACNTQEMIDFEKSQQKESDHITKMLSNKSDNIIHIGGGHDHVYPLLLSLQNLKDFKQIFIINIDAHCDTRVDSKNHSGTPFRNFDENCKMKTTLIQFGIHRYANSELTLSELKNIKQEVIYQGSPLEVNFDEYDNSETLILLSLDADGLDSSIMRAVSAVNSQGIKFTEVITIIDQIKKLKSKNIFGIYEYNPNFDDLSNQGAKTLSHLIYKWLE